MNKLLVIFLLFALTILGCEGTNGPTGEARSMSVRGSSLNLTPYITAGRFAYLHFEMIVTVGDMDAVQITKTSYTQNAELIVQKYGNHTIHVWIQFPNNVEGYYELFNIYGGNLTYLEIYNITFKTFEGGGINLVNIGMKEN